MISTITLNASIDKAYKIPSTLVTGQVTRVASCTDNAGGKGLNAARGIMACGEEVIASGFIGGNNGNLICELLDKDGVNHDFVQVESETRCCINICDPQGTSTELLEPGRIVTSDEINKFLKKLDHLIQISDIITFNGSLPYGMKDDAYKEMIKRVKDAGKPCILDTSSNRLIEGIKSKPTMIKPNTDEIGQIVGRKVTTLTEVAAAAKELHKQGIEKVVVSLGSKGAIMACKSGVYKGTTAKIEAVNPVGSGDTMVGAFAVGILRGLNDADQLKYAMSCATANCIHPKTGYFEASVAQKLYEQTIVEKIA